MKYRLIVTTDGRPDVLAKTLTSIDRRVRPRPSEIVVVDDSGDANYRRYLETLLPVLSIPWQLVWHPARAGFCHSVSDAWAYATRENGNAPPWVLWVEDDIEIVRQIELADLAHVLTQEPQVAQMGLMRQPVNDREKAAGSLFALYRDSYTQQGSGNVAWLRSRTNFSTTASLMRRQFMVEHPWPSYENGCEGRYSIDLLAAGYEFAVWGLGDAWVNHFGTRGGTGY